MFKRVFQSSQKPSASTERVLIKGKKVMLREKRIEDASNDYAWRVDEELARLDATRPLGMSYDDFLRYAREELAAPSPISRRFAIETHDGRHIGNCMCYDIDLRRGQVEVGVMIGDREYWGKGYGPDSVACLLDHTFTSMPMTRVYLHTLSWNHRARRAFAKAGLREVKKVRRNGCGFILMEVWRNDWERMRLSCQRTSAYGPDGGEPGGVDTLR